MKKKDKNTAGILALFFGWLGAHRFYLGQTDKGWLFTFLTGMALMAGRMPTFLRFFAILWIPIVMVIAIVDAIAFFAMDDQKFDEKYNGIPRDRSTDFERKDRSTDFERKKNTQERHRPFPPHKRKRKQQTQMKQRQRPSSRQNNYNKSGKEKFADYDYEGAIIDFEKSVELNPADIAAHFNLSCAYALTENVTKSFYHLELAVAHGFRDFKKIQEHHALAYLRIQPEFDSFVKNGYRMPRKSEAVEKQVEGEDLLASKPDLLDQLNKLAEMRKQGFLTEKEFETRKEMLLHQTE